MQFLIVPSTEGSPTIFALADSTAAWLLHVRLRGADAAAVDWGRALAADDGLRDWAAHHARLSDEAPASVEALTNWLKFHAPLALGGTAASESRLDGETSRLAVGSSTTAPDEWTGPGSADDFPRIWNRLAQWEAMAVAFNELLHAEKLESLAEFAAGAGHEINNPLAVISGRAQLLMRGEADPERRRELAVIHTQALRIHEMIADLMLFARPPQPRPGRCDLNAVADEVIASLTDRAAQQQTTLARNAAPTDIFAHADGEQIAVALRAACQNAIEALDNGGRVEVFVEASPAGPRLSVHDNGPGMSPEERRHAFDPFYSGRQAGRGLGLGLSKCWRIVAAHGGTVEIQSPDGGGTNVLITLPAAAPPDPGVGER